MAERTLDPGAELKPERVQSRLKSERVQSRLKSERVQMEPPIGIWFISTGHRLVLVH